jgi:hypothetical protein
MGQQLVAPSNTKAEVELREKVSLLERLMQDGIEAGELQDASGTHMEYEHIFTPKYDEFGCHNYIRVLHMDAGQVVVGEIHKIPMIHIIMKGRVRCATEKGTKVFSAPSIFVTPAGGKRCGVVEEDCIWVNVLPTKHGSEEDLDLIKAEAIAKSFDEVGLVGSSSELKKLEEEKGK